jgi:hypothetical protein
MSIPLSSILIIYFIFLVFFIIFSYFNIYHIVRFGTLNFTNFLAIFIFIGVSVLILFVSWQYLSQIDWQQSIELFNGVSFSSPY